MRRHAATCLVALAAIAASEGAFAWGTLLWADPVSTADVLAVGASAWAMPRSPLSPQVQALLTPAVDYRRHDGWFASTESGVGIDISGDPAWQYGVRTWPQFGNEHGRGASSQPSIGPRLQGQWFANHMVGGILMVQSALSLGSARQRDGAQFEWGVASGLEVPGGQLGAGLSATWGNSPFRRDYAGVSRAGLSDVSWTLGLDHRINAQWHMDAQLQQAWVMGPGQRYRPWTGMWTLWRDLLP